MHWASGLLYLKMLQLSSLGAFAFQEWFLGSIADTEIMNGTLLKFSTLANTIATSVKYLL